jgi:hypothetical protein
MKLHHNSNEHGESIVKRPEHLKTTLAGVIILVGSLATACGTSPAYAPSSPETSRSSASELHFTHTNITTTYFWVGEGASSDNANISNSPSTWDEEWQQHYGGVDSPKHRNGFSPSAFKPKENPFYVALPYNDINQKTSTRRESAGICRPTAVQTDAHHSFCKNSWIAIRHNGEIVYAQWEDAGPNGENDAAYMRGTHAPRNTFDTRAGLDVSPAVKDYLKLSDVSKTDWVLVTPGQVQAGPWKETVTTSLGETI